MIYDQYAALQNERGVFIVKHKEEVTRMRALRVVRYRILAYFKRQWKWGRANFTWVKRRTKFTRPKCIQMAQLIGAGLSA